MSELELPVTEVSWPTGPAPGQAHAREWLVTNGLGGYASSTVSLCNTRRYHGLLTPSLPGQGRTVMLNHIQEETWVNGALQSLGNQERVDGEGPPTDPPALRSFRMRGLMPEWDFELGPGRLLRRRFVLVHAENTVFLVYENHGDRALPVRLRPFPVFRPHDTLAQEGDGIPSVVARGDRTELLAREGAPALRIRVYSESPAPFVVLSETTPRLLLRTEKSRGYDHAAQLTSPGYFQCEIAPGGRLALGISSDPWERLEGLSPELAFDREKERELRILLNAHPALRVGTPARLTLSADQFLIEPSVRPADEAWARATGQNARSVIAGYHWFTDWGRDTMISLEGLTLSTQRHAEGAAILRTFEHYVRDGLLPNLFPEGGQGGLYNTADATLWFFHAIDRYLTATGDLTLLRDFFPKLEEIIERHVQGTLFNIGVDPADGLLRQGADGVQLTWMDALVDGWVVTPRRGKAVEINALWFNALRLMADWAPQLGKDPGRYADWSERAQVSFNKRFWNPATSCLFDVLDGERGNDPAVRPNQIFSVSLKHPVLRKEHWGAVLEHVRAELLTPVGLRTLSPSDPNYKPNYDGDLRARDAAYHQGTVWPWLLGHFVDAWLRIHPDPAAARALLIGLESHLKDACIGQLSEIFDAQDPHRARGCVAQAWSVAEMLRAWIRTEVGA